ncbi:MAG: hypothetical protein ACRC23_05855, partial [Aeromonas jandaei]
MEVITAACQPPIPAYLLFRLTACSDPRPQHYSSLPTGNIESRNESPFNLMERSHSRRMEICNQPLQANKTGHPKGH